MSIAIIYGSDTGNTEAVAQLILGYFPQATLLNVSAIKAQELQNYSHLIMGIPTWNDGELQGDWYDVYEDIDTLDLSEQTIALFGLGDQQGYPYTFLDAVGLLYEKLIAQGASLVGAWPTDDYDFMDSKAAIDPDFFVGLALDNDTEEELTESRIQNWVSQIKSEGFTL
jgi:flavodoxin long chain